MKGPISGGGGLARIFLPVGGDTGRNQLYLSDVARNKVDVATVDAKIIKFAV